MGKVYYDIRETRKTAFTKTQEMRIREIVEIKLSKYFETNRNSFKSRLRYLENEVNDLNLEIRSLKKCILELNKSVFKNK